VIRDRETKPTPISRRFTQFHFAGKYFKSRGPLNTVRSPQGRPSFIQAGGSPKGRQFAAKYADSIIAVANGVDGMKAYRDDVRARAAAQGRNPDDIKVLFVVSPHGGLTEEEAWARKLNFMESDQFFEQSLASISSVTDIDFSQFDLDEPLPPLETNGERGSLDKFAQWGSGKTLRQLVIDAGGTSDSIELVGTPRSGRGQDGPDNGTVGGDGFLIKQEEGQHALHHRDLRGPHSCTAAQGTGPHGIHARTPARHPARVLNMPVIGFRRRAGRFGDPVGRRWPRCDPTGMVIVVDAETRTTTAISCSPPRTQHRSGWRSMVRHTSGILCVPMPAPDLDRLALPPMVAVKRGSPWHRLRGVGECPHGNHHRNLGGRPGADDLSAGRPRHQAGRPEQARTRVPVAGGGRGRAAPAPGTPRRPSTWR